MNPRSQVRSWTALLVGAVLAALVAGGTASGRVRARAHSSALRWSTAPPLVEGTALVHEFRGPCAGCHPIVIATVPSSAQTAPLALAANRGSQPNTDLAPSPPADQGFFKIGPDIREGQRRLHGYRGPCTYCHEILP